jgi:hypothetical protein
MNSKQIAIKYLAPKLDDSKMIFFDLEIFKSVLFWSRESAREFFATQPTKMFLVHYIDDLGLIVDEYLINRALKMYKNALKKRNKLFWSLGSNEKVIAWLVDRWINTFLNLINEKYLNSIDITKIKIDFNEDMCFYSSNIDEIIEFEKLKKLSKKQIKKALRSVWIDTLGDFQLDIDQFNELCKKFNLNALSVLGKQDSLVKLNFGLESAGSHHNKQLFLLF